MGFKTGDITHSYGLTTSAWGGPIAERLREKEILWLDGTYFSHSQLMSCFHKDRCYDSFFLMNNLLMFIVFFSGYFV
jgi:hypothetical protein